MGRREICEERRKKREDKEADEEGGGGGYLHDPCPPSLPRDPDSEGGGSSKA